MNEFSRGLSIGVGCQTRDKLSELVGGYAFDACVEDWDQAGSSVPGEITSIEINLDPQL